MAPIDPLLSEHRDEIRRIAATHGVRDLRIFGSRARGEAGARSDVDLLVRLDPDRSLLDLVAVKQDLEDLLGCRVDVVTEAAISRYIRAQVVGEAVAL
jgi:predicted nucleotidyltransferase